ncbi:MAG: TIGR00730 family Rossman fold protein [Phycisphaerales bacterium]|nr:TIGR00730 family Rossman fold protein [Phycisphaerales bacterium]
MAKTQLSRLCVFCGSNSGANAIYRTVAVEFGEMLAREGITLVYGGGNVGLMGIIADAVLHHDGRVIGVIPHGLARKEVVHTGLTELHRVDTMHQRKAMMADLADGFVALPGGLGTLDEMFEILTWAQIGIHSKPCAFLNIDGYYDKLFSFLDELVEQQFVKPEHRALALVTDDHREVLQRLRQYEPPHTEKWFNIDQR